jgi:hypothetical protein
MAELWLELTSVSGDMIYVNFAQVVAVVPDEEGSILKTGAGDIRIKETLAYIQGHIKI